MKDFIELANIHLEGWNEHYKVVHDETETYCDGVSMQFYYWLDCLPEEFHKKSWNEKYSLLEQFYKEKQPVVSGG